jgi:hypothetical protein
MRERTKKTKCLAEPDAIMKVIFCCGKVSSMHGHGMHVYLCTLFM